MMLDKYDSSDKSQKLKFPPLRHGTNFKKEPEYLREENFNVG